MSGHKNRSTPHKTPQQGKTASAPATTPAAPAPSALATIQEALRQLDVAKQTHNHRNAFRSLALALTGKEVALDLADGSVVSGVLYAACLYKTHPKRQIVVKGCTLVKAGTSSRSFTAGSTLIFDYQDVVSLSGTPGDLYPNRATAEFRTDSATKKGDSIKHLEGRDLELVSHAWLDPSTQTSLTNGSQQQSNDWDQFETNRRLFNVQDTFDENLYTKALDMSKMTAEQIARAERLAREIESESSSNIHLQEERGQLGEREIDEEALYSGVIRSDYTPNMSGTKTAAPAAKEATGVNAPSWRKPSPGGSHLPENNVWRSRPAVVPDPVSAPASASASAQSSASAPAAQKGKPALAPPVSKTQSQPYQQTKKESSPPGITSKAGVATNKPVVPAPAPAPAAVSAPAAATTAKAETTAEKAKETTSPAAATEKEASKEKPKLNPNAKEFVMNVNAREFVPSFVAPTQPPPAVPVAVPPPASLLLTPPPAPPTGFTPPAPGAFAPSVLPLNPAVQLPPTPATPAAAKTNVSNVHLPLPPLTPTAEAAPLGAMPTPPNFGTLDSAAFLASSMPSSTILPPSPMVDASLAAKMGSPPPAIAPLTPSHPHAHAHAHVQHSPAPAGVLAPPTLVPQMQGFPPHGAFPGAPMQMGYYPSMPMPAVPPANPYYNPQMDPQMAAAMASNVNMGMYPPPMGYQGYYPQQGFMPQMTAAPMPYPSHPPAPYYQGYAPMHENKGGRFPGGGYQGGRKGDGHGRFGGRGRGNPRHQYSHSHSDAQHSQSAQSAQASEQTSSAPAEATPANE